MDNRINQKEVKSLWSERNLSILKILVPLEKQIIKQKVDFNKKEDIDETVRLTGRFALWDWKQYKPELPPMDEEGNIIDKIPYVT